jgi:hypothetical protein
MVTKIEVLAICANLSLSSRSTCARIDYPPWQTVYYHFAAWHHCGVIAHLRDQLRRQRSRDRLQGHPRLRRREENQRTLP